MAFECKIAADSLAPCGARLTTFIVTYPRPIHSEMMTHWALTKSSASSRAIPVEKLIQRVLDDPWIPNYIGKNQKGMQAGEELSEEARTHAVGMWLRARDEAVEYARQLNFQGVHKQVVNRLLEPWMWITVIVSGTDWDNFFGLRCHEAAEPHFQHIARMMRDARDGSVPIKLGIGHWHLPLVFEEDWEHAKAQGLSGPSSNIQEALIKVSVGRCARVSYLNHEGKRDLQADIDLHDRLMVQRPLHAAPAEHVARALDWPKWFHGPMARNYETVYKLRESVVMSRKQRVRSDIIAAHHAYHEGALGELTSGNYLGFQQYRKTLADENIGGLMP